MTSTRWRWRRDGGWRGRRGENERGLAKSASMCNEDGLRVPQGKARRPVAPSPADGRSWLALDERDGLLTPRADRAAVGFRVTGGDVSFVFTNGRATKPRKRITNTPYRPRRLLQHRHIIASGRHVEHRERHRRCDEDARVGEVRARAHPTAEPKADRCARVGLGMRAKIAVGVEDEGVRICARVVREFPARRG